jgi:hypothetical protein
MRCRWCLALVALVLSVSLFATADAGTGQSITANVLVTCPINITLAPGSSYYVMPSNVVFGYSVNTLVPCTIPTLTGYLNVTNASTHALTYQTPITVNDVTSARSGNSVTVLASTLGRGTSDAKLSLSESQSYSNYTSNSVLVLQPANIVVEKFSVSPSTVMQGSLISISEKVQNTGNLASSSMNAVIDIFYPNNTLLLSASKQMSPLSPGQKGVISITLSNATQYTGNFTAYGSVTYTSYGSNRSTSNNGIAAYSVVTNPGQGQGQSGSHGSKPSPPAPPPTNSGGYLSFTTAPLYLNIIGGLADLSSVGLLDTSSYRSIVVNITAPKLAFANITLSATSILLKPGQGQSIQLSINGTNGMLLGTYTIPLNITISEVNSSSTPVKETLFVSANLEGNATQNGGTFATSVSYSGALDQASCQLLVRNAFNYTVNDSVVTVTLPLSVAGNASDITLSGSGVGEVNETPNGYVLEWTVPQLKPRASAYVYYTVKNVTNPQFLQDAPVTFTSTSVQKTAQLTLLGLYTPQVYANSSGEVYVNVLYVGGEPSNVTFELVPPPQISVLNNYQTVSIAPDSSLSLAFGIKASTAGTYYMKLKAFGPLINTSYNMSIQVLPTSQEEASGQNASAQGSISAGIAAELVLYAYFIVAVAAVLVAGFIVTKTIGDRPRYDKARVAKLITVRERLKREKPRDDYGE